MRILKWITVRARLGRGASGIEYGLLLGLLVVAVMAAVGSTGTSLSSVLCMVSNTLASVTSTIASGCITNRPSISWNVSSDANMNVIAPAWYGTRVTFTLTNTGTVATGPITIAQTNSTILQDVGNGCQGVSLLPKGSCACAVEPEHSSNALYSGTLTATDANASDNTSPAVLALSGSASGFPTAPSVTVATSELVVSGSSVQPIIIPASAVFSNVNAGNSPVLTWSVYGQAVLTGDHLTGTITYTPASGAVPLTGTAGNPPAVGSFQYQVTETGGNSASGTATISLAPCASGDAVGTVCFKADLNQTVVSAGTAYTNGPTLYVYPAAEISYKWASGTAATKLMFTSAGATNYGSDYTAPTTDYDGQNETAQLLALEPGTYAKGSFPAAEGCASLGAAWYVPAGGELNALVQDAAGTALGIGFNQLVLGHNFVATTAHWTASESTSSTSWYQTATPAFSAVAKATSYYVRCVRQ